ncbi:hypothetical protein OG799_32085 [Micromonospora sp. NBC_00898]|uniref:sigma factor n=1 Tax=Micromonospora sp. NBC_00898 TaxID=2975981 RepID=UPI0038652117|nr:hypothetical protein OG799_32085 [Micromonospora sp. NBC_00898]
MGTADVEAVWRIESARIVAALTRFTGDFGLAEDAAQEAVAEALVSWPLASPANPAGWLMATARRRAIDAIRRRTALQDRYALLAADLAVDSAVDEEIDPDKIDDDVLASPTVATSSAVPAPRPSTGCTGCCWNCCPAGRRSSCPRRRPACWSRPSSPETSSARPDVDSPSNSSVNSKASTGKSSLRTRT